MNKERQREEKRIRHLLLAIDPLDQPSYTPEGQAKWRSISRQAQALNRDPITRTFLHAFLNNARHVLNADMQSPEVRRLLLGDWAGFVQEKKKR